MRGALAAWRSEFVPSSSPFEAQEVCQAMMPSKCRRRKSTTFLIGCRRERVAPAHQPRRYSGGVAGVLVVEGWDVLPLDQLLLQGVIFPDAGWPCGQASIAPLVNVAVHSRNPIKTSAAPFRMSSTNSAQFRRASDTSVSIRTTIPICAHRRQVSPLLVAVQLE